MIDISRHLQLYSIVKSFSNESPIQYKISKNKYTVKGNELPVLGLTLYYVTHIKHLCGLTLDVSS